MNSTSNGQSSISDDGKPVPQTQLPAPPQQPPVPTNTDAMTGDTQDQPRTRTGTQTPPRTPTRVKRQSWSRILSGGDNLVKLAKPLLAANFGAVISLVTSRLDGSRFHYLSSKLADAKSFDTVVACFAIGFTCNMHVMLLQKDSPIAARIGGYAGALSSVIGFLTMIQILLPPALLWIVWSAAVSIFLSFLYNLANNWFDTEDENVDTEGQNVDTEGENVLFYWGGEIVSDHEGVSYNCDAKKLCKVEKGTTLRQLKAMIKPEMALNEENVQLKFNYRIPRQQSSGLRFKDQLSRNSVTRSWIIRVIHERGSSRNHLLYLGTLLGEDLKTGLPIVEKGRITSIKSKLLDLPIYYMS
ncbi:uncharacterized protein LOC114283438 isoform X1 [Camellia sinensis]|uniref:uncharacterized protein LOC114283438 isoform X1 n=2 Tax=Camellia sinensis TaxID=4442 RepID=UPI00103631D3|nr:uncharacterized protein LOC114283438 isoform X1 [Camellia sinensis]